MKKLVALILTVLLCSCNKGKLWESTSARHDRLCNQYPEVVQISRRSFVAVDNKGNIHLISDNAGDTIIIEYNEIEQVLVRDFTATSIKQN